MTNVIFTLRERNRELTFTIHKLDFVFHKSRKPHVYPDYIFHAWLLLGDLMAEAGDILCFSYC